MPELPDMSPPKPPPMSAERIAEQAVMKQRIADIAAQKLLLHNLTKTMRDSIKNRPTNRSYRGGAF